MMMIMMIIDDDDMVSKISQNRYKRQIALLKPHMQIK